MTVYGIHFVWWQIVCGLTITAAYLVPLVAGVPLLKAVLLGCGWQIFLLTLIGILEKRAA